MSNENIEKIISKPESIVNDSSNSRIDFNETENNHSFKFSDCVTLENIRGLNEQFANERNLGTRDTPRNILLALVGEVGELAELFQWRNEVKIGLPDWSLSDREAVAQELSDVLIYLVRLADRCRIDLPAAAEQKLEHNALKYPIINDSEK